METPHKAKNVRVIKNEADPETPEVMAESIIRISKGFKKLMDEGLNKRAIIVLIQGIPGIHLSAKSIEIVLDNLPKLASYYVKNQ